MDFLFSEKDILEEILKDEKFLLVKCSQLLGESSCQELRRLVTEIMTESQQLQFELGNAMRNRGWLSREEADTGKIQKLVGEMMAVRERL